MAVAPKFAAHIFAPATAAPAHTLEIYLDYVCPFSAKIFSRIYNDVKPHVDSHYAGKLNIIFRHQVQPWHPSSTLTHEAALAVEHVQPRKFWEFSKVLFEQQKNYFDVHVVNDTRNATYGKLAKLAESVGVNEGKVLRLLKVSESEVEGQANVGNGVTDDLKLHIKAARLVGVHVSPTVVFNGNVDGTVSSGWGKEEWVKWLEKNVV